MFLPLLFVLVKPSEYHTLTRKRRKLLQPLRRNADYRQSHNNTTKQDKRKAPRNGTVLERQVNLHNPRKCFCITSNTKGGKLLLHILRRLKFLEALCRRNEPPLRLALNRKPLPENQFGSWRLLGGKIHKRPLKLILLYTTTPYQYRQAIQTLFTTRGTLVGNEKHKGTPCCELRQGVTVVIFLVQNAIAYILVCSK